MLEQCTDLQQCELALAPLARSVRLLGEIPLSSNDHKLLTRLIRAQIGPSVGRGTRQLTKNAPTCFACFLVFMGRVTYQEGDYWSAVHAALSTAGGPIQNRWGRFFLAFLKDRELPSFQIEGTYRYVTPILLHGGIPDHELVDFFEKIVRPMAMRHRTEPSEVAALELAQAREALAVAENLKQELETDRKEILRLQRKQQQHSALLSAYDEFRKLDELNQELQRIATQVQETVPAADMVDTASGVGEDLKKLDSHLAHARRQRELSRKRLEKLASDASPLLKQQDTIREALRLRDVLEHARDEIADLSAEQHRVERQIEQMWTTISDLPWCTDYSHAMMTLDVSAICGVADEYLQARQLLSRAEESREAYVSRYVSWSAQWRMVTKTILAAATMWTAVGFVLIRSYIVLALALVVDIAVAGFLAGSWLIQRRRHKQRTASLDQTVLQAEAASRVAHAKMAQALGGLPVNPDTLCEQMLAALVEIEEASRALHRLDEGIKSTRSTHKYSQHQLQEAAKVLKLQAPSDSPGDIVDALQAALEKAHRTEELINREAATLSTLEAQVTGLETQMSLRQLEYTQEQQHRADDAVAVEKGLLEQEAARLRAELVSAYGKQLPSLETAFNRAKNRDMAKSDIANTVERVDLEIASTKEAMRQATARLEKLEMPFAGVNKPVRRYLLYGGDDAKSLLIHAVASMQGMLYTGRAPDEARRELPTRIGEALEAWWNEQASCVDTHRGRSSDGVVTRYSSPEIRLDTATQIMNLSFPSQRMDLASAEQGLHIRIYDADSSKLMSDTPLRSYRTGPAQAETTTLETALARPASSYRVSVEAEKTVLRTWNLAALTHEVPYLLFSAASGRTIPSNTVPPSQCWLVAARGTEIEPDTCIVQRECLLGAWSEYELVLLDPIGVDSVQLLLNGHTVTSTLVVAELAGREPELVGSSPLKGVWSNGAPVFLGVAPEVRIPIESNEDFEYCEVTVLDIATEGEVRQRYQLGEILDPMDFHKDEDWTTLSLDQPGLLGKVPTGRFTIQIDSLSQGQWRTTFCILPELDVRFKRRVYGAWQRGQSPDGVSLTIGLPVGVRFEPSDESQIVHTTRTSVELRSPFQNVISGTILLPKVPEPTSIPLTIEVPILRWRLRTGDTAEDWQLEAREEQWLGNWDGLPELSLDLQVPSASDRPVILGTDPDLGIRLAAAEVDGLFRIDLLPIRDSLRRSDLSWLTVRFGDCDDGDVRICSVRSKWLAEELECVQTEENGWISLAVQWQTKGKAEEILVRLWRCDGAPQILIQEQRLPGTATSTSVSIPIADLPPGSYLLQLVPTDSWSLPPSVCPSAADQNVIDLEVVAATHLRQDHVLEIREIEFNGMCWEPSLPYQFRVIGKIVGRDLPERSGDQRQVVVTRGNEGWYLCELIASLDSDSYLEMIDGNPFKVDYRLAENDVTAIEDRTGEGAMYCPRCRRLYWRDGEIRSEVARKHPIVGPIEKFRVRWIE